jgi:hypothetical protein
MTIKELKDSLAKLPPEYDDWPVTVLITAFKVEISPAFIVPGHHNEIMLETANRDDHKTWKPNHGGKPLEPTRR